MMDGTGSEIAKEFLSKLLIPFAVTFVLGILLGFWFSSDNVTEKKELEIKVNSIFYEIEVGECYIQQFKSTNPFKSYKADTILIIDKKGDYVKYRQNDGYTGSSKIEYLFNDIIETDSCNCL